jgi:alpha-galactosidase
VSDVVIAVVGGGSSMFVPGVVRRMLEIDAFDGAELRLMDVNPKRLGVMVDLARQLARAEGRRLSVIGTSDRRAALDGVTFAIVAISVGGMAAWESDIEIPARHGVFMHIADSIGPGGIFRSLRNTPVVASVARDLAELSPGAILFNYTNPTRTRPALTRWRWPRSLASARCRSARARPIRSSGAGWQTLSAWTNPRC